ncbi:hypothetical protein AVEN_32954-1 [Araneus ventricosus]|uniref:Uncharacterized protein n=1 Tax=Araneus ventricosus TaxID=182803 RepID=A0A4Y2INZ5_ARAVE|nr:hypothetical protein AVEN_32954-1 [Araneus ventricosus]
MQHPAFHHSPHCCAPQPSFTTTTAGPRRPSPTTTSAAQTSTAAPEPSAAQGAPLGRETANEDNEPKTVGSWSKKVLKPPLSSVGWCIVNLLQTVQLWTLYVLNNMGLLFREKC